MKGVLTKDELIQLKLRKAEEKVEEERRKAEEERRKAEEERQKLTGFGKTLCYACLPNVFDKLYGVDNSTIIVISPLTSIMTTQI